MGVRIILASTHIKTRKGGSDFRRYPHISAKHMIFDYIDHEDEWLSIRKNESWIDVRQRYKLHSENDKEGSRRWITKLRY